MFATSFIHRTFRLVFAIAVYSTLVVTANANHPFHVATAETRWNLETRKLEVSIRCHPVDLETALRRRTGKKIDLDKTENIDQLLTEYLSETFQLHSGPLPKPITPTISPAEALNQPQNVTDAKSTANTDGDSKNLAKFHWVGKEIDAKWAWLYLELEPKDLVQEMYMTNTILMDVLDDQSNTVIIRLATDRQSLMFHQKKRTLPFPRPSDFAPKTE